MKPYIAHLTLLAAVIAAAIIAVTQDEFSFLLIVSGLVVGIFLLAWLISQPRRPFPTPTLVPAKRRSPLAIEIIDSLPPD